MDCSVETLVACLLAGIAHEEKIFWCFFILALVLWLALKLFLNG
jgi:hypothetical protein